MKRGLVARATLVERMEARLRTESFPRLIMSAVVSVAGGIAFLFSALTLWAGLESMAVRYGLAALVGYLAFGAGIGLWLRWRRGSLDGSGDLATSVAGRPRESFPLKVATPVSVSGSLDDQTCREY